MRRLVWTLPFLVACEAQRIGPLADLADSVTDGRRLECTQGHYILDAISLSPYGGARRPIRGCADTTGDTAVMIAVDADGRVLEVSRGIVVPGSEASKRFEELVDLLDVPHGSAVRCNPVHDPEIAREIYWNTDSQFVRLKFLGDGYLWWERALGTGWCESGPADTSRAGA